MPDVSFSFADPPLSLGASTAPHPVARAIKVDPSTGDLVHDGVRLQLVADNDSIAQSLRTRLAFFKGEWFLDEEFGTPYFQSILGKSLPLIAVREVFREVIAGTVGVLDIVSLDLRATSVPRQFQLQFVVSTDLGELSLTVPTGVL